MVLVNRCLVARMMRQKVTEPKFNGKSSYCPSVRLTNRANTIIIINLIPFSLRLCSVVPDIKLLLIFAFIRNA